MRNKTKPRIKKHGCPDHVQHIRSEWEELGRACFLGRDVQHGHCSNKKDLQEEGFLRLFMSSQKHKLPSSSAHHIAFPVEQEGLTKVMAPVSISAAWRILIRRSRALPWWRNRHVWLGVGCSWSAEISAFQFGWREKWVGSSRQHAGKERRRGLRRTGVGWQEVWISQRRISSSSQSWSWGGILVCIVACFASKMTLSFPTNHGWFCNPFLYFFFFLSFFYEAMDFWCLVLCSF